MSIHTIGGAGTVEPPASHAEGTNRGRFKRSGNGRIILRIVLFIVRIMPRYLTVRHPSSGGSAPSTQGRRVVLLTFLIVSVTVSGIGLSAPARESGGTATGDLSRSAPIETALPSGAALGPTQIATAPLFRVPEQPSDSFAPVLNYSLTISETGLPAGALWAVTVAGATRTTNLSSLLLGVPNGSYPYSFVSPVYSGGRWFAATPLNGTAVVDGSPVSVSVSFSPVSTFQATFRSIGLPSGSEWGVELGAPGLGLNGSTLGTTLALRVPPGPIPLALTSPPGFGVARITGPGRPTQTMLDLPGNATFKLSFAPVEPLTFAESSLPNGTVWGVEITPAVAHGGPLPQNATTNSTALNFSVVKGSWRFVIAPRPSVDRPTPGRGVVSVPSHAVTKTIRFQLVTENVVFRETGLVRAPWQVTLSGPENLTMATDARTQSTLLTNGTYTFAVSTTTGSVPAPASGSLVVVAPGPPIVVKIRFSSPDPSPSDRILSPASALPFPGDSAQGAAHVIWVRILPHAAPVPVAGP